MISITALSKIYPYREKALFKNFSLNIKNGEFVALLGANGMGKTTLLRMIAGLESFSSGKIMINEKVPQKAKIGYIPQNYSQTLFPWYTVAENITLPLKISGVVKRARLDELEKLANDYSIILPWNEYPYNLSGGQQQMVAILRGIINFPNILLMDEPFSSLDVKTSIETQEKLLQIWSKRKITTIFVSHRTEESIYLANRIVILQGNPTCIKKDFHNPLPYPRQFSTLFSTSFSKLLTQSYYEILQQQEQR